MFKLLDKKYPYFYNPHYYNDRVWDRWRRFHNFNTSFIISLIGHMVWVLMSDIPYRWTINPKFKDRVYH